MTPSELKTLDLPKVKNFPDFVLGLMIRPILLRPRVIMVGIFALAVLSLAQAGMLFLVKGFLTAFFLSPSVSVVSLNELIPAKLRAYTIWQENFSQLESLVFNREEFAWFIPIAIVAAGLLNALASYGYNISQEDIALGVGRHYRDIMFSAVLRLPYLATLRRSPGEWMSVIMADSQFLQARLADLLTGFVKDGVLIFACLLSLSLIHWPSALMLFLLAPLIAWQMGTAGKKISFFAEAFQTELAKLAAALLDMRNRFRYMKSQNAEMFELTVFQEANERYLKMITSSIFIRALVTPMMEWVGFVIFAVFLWSWSHRYLGESFTPEIAVQFFVALGLLLRPTRQMGEQVARLGETIGGLKASMGVLQEIDRLVKVEPAPASKVSSDALGQDDIQIERIECCYDGRLTFAASDLNLRLGKAVAIVGASGAGKSTFLKSIAGLIEPAVWRASCSWPTAVRRTAFVSQTPFLFHDSIRNNLVYGLEREILQQTTDEMLYASLSIVKLDTFVRGLPLGLQTTFHPVAHNFSGGQIQRLVIARALLRRRPILLLDEATSAIDGATEKHITEVLVSTVHETRTSLFSVTHRLTWLALFDEVWFIKDGTVALKGPHIQLMESHSDYRSFVTSENAKKEAT